MPTIPTLMPNSSGLTRLWSMDKTASASWIMETEWTMIRCTRCSGIDTDQTIDNAVIDILTKELHFSPQALGTVKR